MRWGLLEKVLECFGNTHECYGYRLKWCQPYTGGDGGEGGGEGEAVCGGNVLGKGQAVAGRSEAE